MPGRGTVAACAIGTLVIVIRMHGRFVRKWWFWTIIGIATIANTWLLIDFPFAEKNYTFAVIAPIGYIEYLLVAWCIRRTAGSFGDASVRR